MADAPSPVLGEQFSPGVNLQDASVAVGRELPSKVQIERIGKQLAKSRTGFVQQPRQARARRAQDIQLLAAQVAHQQVPHSGKLGISRCRLNRGAAEHALPP